MDRDHRVGRKQVMYVLIIIQTAKDGTVTPAAYAYGTLDEAKAAYFSELAAGASSDALASDACLVINQTGGMVKCECIEHKAAGAPDSGAASATETDRN